MASSEVIDFVFDAINLAKNLCGINLKVDSFNRAQGDCLLESIILNVNHRKEFEKIKLDKSVDEYRKEWSLVGSLVTKNYGVFTGYSSAEFDAGWKKLSQPLEYNIPDFGDAMITVISHCLQLDILLINTTAKNILLIQCNTFMESRTAKSEHPIILCYSSFPILHYESLLPVDSSDVAHASILRKDYFLADPSFV